MKKEEVSTIAKKWKDKYDYNKPIKVTSDWDKIKALAKALFYLYNE